jgi:hypothetical protein
MGNTIWERLAHITFGIALLVGLALFAGQTIKPSPAVGLPADAPRTPVVALSDAAPDTGPPVCDAR